MYSGLVVVDRWPGIVLLNPLAIKAIQNCHVVAATLVAEVGQNGHDLVGLEAIGDVIPIKDRQVDHFREADLRHCHRVMVDQVASVQMQTFEG